MGDCCLEHGHEEHLSQHLGKVKERSRASISQMDGTASAESPVPTGLLYLKKSSPGVGGALPKWLSGKDSVCQCRKQGRQGLHP